MDPAIQMMSAAIYANQQSTSAVLQQLATNQAATKPTTPFPKWNSKRETVPIWLVQLDNYKGDVFFRSVFDWSQTLPNTAIQSRQVYTDLFRDGNLPKDELNQFLNRTELVNKGFETLALLVSFLNPDSPLNRLEDVQELTALAQDSTETAQAYMAKVRGLEQRLSSVTVESLLPVFAINGMTTLASGASLRVG